MAGYIFFYDLDGAMADNAYHRGIIHPWSTWRGEAVKGAARRRCAFPLLPFSLSTSVASSSLSADVYRKLQHTAYFPAAHGVSAIRSIVPCCQLLCLHYHSRINLRIHGDLTCCELVSLGDCAFTILDLTSRLVSCIAVIIVLFCGCWNNNVNVVPFSFFYYKMIWPELGDFMNRNW
jgi:hypothetical protein